MSLINDFKHPIFLQSFVALLGIDIAYTFLLVMQGLTELNAAGILASFQWFIFFYLMPSWVSLLVVFRLRRYGISAPFKEWLVTVSAFTTGNQLLSWVFEFGWQIPGGLNMGLFVITNGLVWGTSAYGIVSFIEYRKKAAAEKQAAQKAQLQALRYQLNPHFMFNSLNTISAYIYQDPMLADEAVHKLADVLRYSLNNGEKEKVSLNEELTLIENYLAIEQARFGERLIVNYEIAQDARGCQIPPFLLQPIVENSFKQCAAQEMLEISIKAWISGGKLNINISDNGLGFTDETLTFSHKNGIGMHNLKRRIEMQPGGRVSLSSKNGAIVNIAMQV
ncbi:sensor histidine kinase [Veronia nyctiphanis]|uniref:sensor histidine kinase n=1 Tax=Veronia nyctiphanis TaxID=1278244 RepID=UPI00100A81BE|nr:histidine kinase [Veronia nyctiphanis]